MSMYTARMLVLTVNTPMSVQMAALLGFQQLYCCILFGIQSAHLLLCNQVQSLASYSKVRLH